MSHTRDLPLPHIQTLGEELEQVRDDLCHWKLMLRQADSVERVIECRLEIGRCSQRIRRLELERRGERLV